MKTPWILHPQSIRIETKISDVSVSNIILKQNNMLEQNEPVALTLYKKISLHKIAVRHQPLLQNAFQLLFLVRKFSWRLYDIGLWLDSV